MTKYALGEFIEFLGICKIFIPHNLMLHVGGTTVLPKPGKHFLTQLHDDGSPNLLYFAATVIKISIILAPFLLVLYVTPYPIH